MRLLTLLLMSLYSKLTVGVNVSMNGCLSYVSAAMSWRLEKGWSHHHRHALLSHRKWCKMSGLHRCHSVFVEGSAIPFHRSLVIYSRFVLVESNRAVFKTSVKAVQRPLLLHFSSAHRLCGLFYQNIQYFTSLYEQLQNPTKLVWGFHLCNLSL